MLASNCHPVKIRKRSLVSLCVMINKEKTYGDEDDDERWKGLTRLREDEAGDLAAAQKIVTSIIKWLGLTWKASEAYLKSGGDPFLGGEETVELPGVDGLEEFLDGDFVLPPLQ
jgi:hypothetical protein